MLIDIHHSNYREVHPDGAAIICMLNAVYASAPERFGSPATRQAISDACNGQHMRTHRGTIDLDRLADALPALFAHHNITPLAGIDVVFVAPDPLALLDHEALLASCNLHCISANDKLYTHNAHALAGGIKADIVITGNVLNAPRNRTPEDTMRAAAMMLKPGGTAIHMLSYGEAGSDISHGAISTIAADDVHARCNQRHTENIPPGAYQRNGSTYAILLNQIAPLAYTLAPTPTASAITPERLQLSSRSKL